MAQKNGRSYGMRPNPDDGRVYPEGRMPSSHSAYGYGKPGPTLFRQSFDQPPKKSPQSAASAPRRGNTSVPPKTAQNGPNRPYAGGERRSRIAPQNFRGTLGGPQSNNTAKRPPTDLRTVRDPSFMDARQRAIYEDAYRRKYGTSPYVSQNNGSGQHRNIPRDAQRPQDTGQYPGGYCRDARSEDRYKEEKRRREAARVRAEKEKRRREVRRKLERKKRRRQIARSFAFHAKISLAAMLAVAIITAALTYLRFCTDPTERGIDMTYRFGNGVTETADGSTAYPSGVLYINFSTLADYLSMSYRGDSESFLFVLGTDNGSLSSATDGEWVEFRLGTTEANVNGTPVAMKAPSKYLESGLWVPIGITDCFKSGITVEQNGKRTVTVEKTAKTDEEGKILKDENGQTVYENVTFIYNANSVPGTISLDEIYGRTNPGVGKGSTVTFTSDLGTYEKYMNPEDTTEFLTIVSKSSPLGENYEPEDLTEISDTKSDGRAPVKMRNTAAMALDAMFNEMRACGIRDVSVTDGYRSYRTEAAIFTSLVNEEKASGLTDTQAKNKVLTYASSPGTSEHQTGLACDIHNMDEPDASFANTTAYKWLAENSWKFGYIVRYPEGKADATGHDFEPWHFRYVGRRTAEQLKITGMCLEEYLAINPLS